MACTVFGIRPNRLSGNADLRKEYEPGFARGWEEWQLLYKWVSSGHRPCDIADKLSINLASSFPLPESDEELAFE